MQIECPSCARSYTISPSALGDGGRSVVCAACQTRWFVEANTPAAMTLVPPKRERQTALRRDGARDPRARRAPNEPVTTRTNRYAASLASAVCLVVVMASIGARTPLVRAVPRLAAIYAGLGLPVNVRGLDFKDVKTVRATEAGRSDVAISGSIRNLSRSRTAVPRLTFDIRDALGTTIASWTESAPRRMLGGQESVPFATHAPNLPEGSSDVVVRFASDLETRDADTRLVERR